MAITLSAENREKVEMLLTRLQILRSQGGVIDPIIILWNPGDDAVLLAVHDRGRTIGLSTTLEPTPGNRAIVANDVADALKQAGTFDRYGVRYEVQARR
jgi:hypothetical protein